MALYAGIGSIKTPPDILEVMTDIASQLAQTGYTLRSGAEQGAGAAFEFGCDQQQGPKEIWLPWLAFNGHAMPCFLPTPDHETLAAELHPYWFNLGQGARKRHSSKVGQVVGMDLNTPVDFVLCWTPDGCESNPTRSMSTGGTATAIALADRLQIPVINLQNRDAIFRLERYF